MGKSEVNPYGPVNESSSSESDQDFVIEPPFCDGADGATGGDEVKVVEEGEGRDGHDEGRNGPWGPSGMDPMMFMMMMGGLPRGRRGCGGKKRCKSPEGQCPKRDEMRRCRSAPGRNGQPCGPGPAGPCGFGPAPEGAIGGPRYGFRCGPPRRGPFMKKSWMKWMMMSNPEFWQNMMEENVTDDENEQRNEEKSKKKCGRKCNGKRQEKWRRMRQMFEAMNLHAPTDSEGDGERPTTEKPQEKSDEKSEAASEKKQVHFGENDYCDDTEMMPEDPRMFPGFPGGRPFGRPWGGPWARPGGFRGMGMRPDPRMMMMHADPRMAHGCPAMPPMPPMHHGRHGHHGHQGHHGHHGHNGNHGHHGHHGGPRMMSGGPMGWMFHNMMMNPLNGNGDQQSESEGEMKNGGRKCEMREKRMKFRKAVREIGVKRWMFWILAQQLQAAKKSGSEKADSSDDENVNLDEMRKGMRWNEKKEKYLQVLQEIGAEPWMFKVLVNQKARACSRGPCKSRDEEFGQDGGAEAGPGKFGWFPRRRFFRKMAAAQMAATSDSEATSDVEGWSAGEEEKNEMQRRKEGRQRMREMMRGMGWMPWMMDRWRHPAHHHQRRHWRAESENETEKSGDELTSAKSDEKREEMQKPGRREKVQKFRQVVQEIGVQPWMFKRLASELFSAKSAVPESAAARDEQMEETSEEQQKYMLTLREVGASPWMFRVLANQSARAASRDSEGESLPEGATAAVEENPRAKRKAMKRKMLREIAAQMGWSSDSEGTSEGEAEKKEDKQKRK